MKSRSKKTGILVFLLFTIASAGAQSFSISWAAEKRPKQRFDDAIQLPGGNSIVVKLKQKTNSYGTYFIPVLSLLDSSME